MSLRLWLAAATWGALPAFAWAQPQAGGIEEIARLLDSGRVVEAPVFAPRSWEEAQKAYASARTLQEKGGESGELQKRIEQALDKAGKALAAAAVSKQELAAFLPIRTRAREAKAQFVVPVNYGRAEDQFTAATRKVESGNLQGAQADAAKAGPLFDAAELAALHKTTLETADSLLAEAEEAEADHYAPISLKRARGHRERAYQLIIADRTDRAEAHREAAAAEYESRHAAQLAGTIRVFEREDRTWEDLLLEFEAETHRVAKSTGGGPVAFDRGLKPATDSVVARIEALSADLAAAGSELSDVSSVLSKALSETGESSPSSHPVELATQASDRLARLTEEKSDWARMAKARQAQLAEVSQIADETAFELEQRRVREEKFKAAQQALTVSEGVVLYNERNDIVLRLTGLSFEPGQSELSSRHQKLLTKVGEILKQFPGQRIVVEGHTDARGSKAGNLALSEKRAQSVRDQLLKDPTLAAEAIEAKGYGDEHPVASNSSADGRAKNRRIDVLIVQ